MSTLTLAVENHFSSEMLTSSQTSLSHTSAPCSRLAPGTLADLSSIYLKSLPDLIPAQKTDTVAPVPEPVRDDPLSKDDSALSVLWVRPSKAVAIPESINIPEGVTLPGSVTIPDTVNIPLVSKPVSTPSSPLDLPQVSVQLTETVLTECPSDKPRAVSEGAIRTPLRKLKLSLRIPLLSRVQSASQLSPKSVKFASRLENVKMFDGKDSPSSVSLQNTPCGSPNSSYNFASDYFSIPRSFGDLVDDSDSDSDDNAVEMLYKINSSNFVAPKNIYDKKNSPVYLQKAVLSADKKSLVLIVMCQNLAFEKALSLKLTFNDWKSQMIFNNSTYVSLFASANFDQFRFSIPLTHLPSSISPQFCIKYTVNKTTYWDNNNGGNYQFSLSASAKPKSSRDTIALKAGSKDTFSYKPPTFSQAASFTVGLYTSSPLPAPAGGLSDGTDYDELVSKLNSVKNSSESLFVRPSLLRSNSFQPDQRPTPPRTNSLQTKPRYSKSYKSKAVASEPESPLKNKGEAKVSEESDSKEAEPVAKDLKSSDIGSMSYADLLQKYCFNGAQNNSQSGVSSPFDSIASSRNSSASSISSDYVSHGPAFNSSGTFYV